MSDKSNHPGGREEVDRPPVVRLRVADLFSALSLAVALTVVGLSVLRERRSDWKDEIRAVESRVTAEINRLWVVVDRIRERQ